MSVAAKKLKARYRERGAASVIAFVLRKGLSKLYDREDDVIIVCDLAVDDLAAPASPIRVRRSDDCDSSALVAFASSHGIPTSSSRAVRQATDSYPCFVAFDDGEIIGCCWWVSPATKRYHPDLNLTGIQLDQDEAYVFWLFVAPEHRGGGRATDVLLTTMRELADLRFRRLWGFVLADNRPARWLFAVAGFQELETRRVHTLGSLIAVADHEIFLRNFALISKDAFGFRRIASLEMHRTTEPIRRCLRLVDAHARRALSRRR